MKISIITTTFNSSRTLRDTFDSVLRQSYKDIEYIVIDGGSTDGTVDIIKEYEPKFEGRIRWVSEADRGFSSSGISSHLQINKDHHRALRENGVYSNYFLLSLRYIYKLIELTKATCGCADGLRADGK